MPVTRRQRVFIEEYLTCWNATEAARRAGFADPNAQGGRLLLNISIKEAIYARMREKTMEADEVLRRLDQQAKLNASDFFVDDGVLDWGKVKEYGYLIKKIYQTKYGWALEFYDAQRALELIGKHKGMFVEKVETTNRNEETRVSIYIPDNGRGNEHD